MATLVTTITETLRYRGKLGQWSWVFHRASGLGVLLFVYLHIVDTSWSAFYPELYAEAIHFYQSPLFTLGEFGLVAAVVYHAFNGYRIILLDYKPHLWKHQALASQITFAVTILVLIPVFALMFGHVLDHYGDIDGFGIDTIINGDDTGKVAGLSDAIVGQLQFAIGLLVVVGISLVVSLVYDMLFSRGGPEQKSRVPYKRPSQIDVWFWKFMRISGLLILPLVFGHLAMMHIISGVFDITGSGTDIVGTGTVNQTSSALAFVGERWDYLVAGVAVWRLYDGALLALVVTHGFYGLTLVVNDYAHNYLVRRALNWTIVFGAVFLIMLGTATLIAGVEDSARDIVHEAAGE
jgi:succinate dehydrogenase / fumarate reductase cytochrome b subunit